MVIPGVTDIDPGLKAADADDTFARMARNTARGGRFVLPMGGAFMPGGIVGEAIVMGAALYGATRTPETHVDAMPVGDASSAAVQMAAKLDAEPGGAAQPPAASAGAGPASGAAAATDAGAPSPVQDPWSDLPPVAVQDEIAPRDLASEVAAPFNAGGPAPVQDPWGDLPPVPAEEQIAGTELDPWAVRDQSAAAARYDPWATPSAPPNPDAAASPTPDPWATGSGPWSGDPWAAGPGPWSQDLWGSTAGQSGDDTSEPRKPR